MTSRRLFVAASLSGLATAACASVATGHGEPSLADVLIALPSMKTVAEFNEEFAVEYGREVFSSREISSDSNTSSEEDYDSWLRYYRTSRSDLIDTMPPGAVVYTYFFDDDNFGNRLRANLKVFTDTRGEIIGWAYPAHVNPAKQWFSY